MNAINPFGIVKANEFTISQIVENWVPLAGSKNDYIAPLMPNELMPKYVLGSKGCGKTHLLRYYSFEARLESHNNDIKELLKKDKYLASYSRLNSLSSARFTKGDDSEEWKSLYNYYFELIQSLISLDVYKHVTEALITPRENVSNAIRQICNKVGFAVEEYSTDCLMTVLNNWRVAVDREIIDFPHSRKLNWERVRPAFSFGALMFEIPYCFSQHVHELKDVHYIYILDEYEKLTCNWMKESLNTLVFERTHNVTFWVGARKTGYDTWQTMSGEPIHEGHEFKPVDLDALLKEKEDRFSNFVIDLFKKRLKLNGMSDMEPTELFEEFEEKRLLRNLVQKQVNGGVLKHWTTFRRRLESIGLEKESISRMGQMLCKDVPEDPIAQKFKLYAFYLLWSLKRKVITKEFVQTLPNAVNEAYDAFRLGNNKKMRELYNKFRQDMVAQLAEENNEPLYLYSGFGKLVDIADCNPRIFLTLMKLIIEDCHFRGVDPFCGEKTISVRSQYVGINETAKWFLNDVEVHGKAREDLHLAMNHLLTFLYVSRFCDKPTETSLCSFYYRMNTEQSKIDHIITLALREAFLMELPNKRKDKTLKTPQKSYQVNRLIATVFNLPIARRGVISIPPKMLKAIFDPDCFEEFNSLLAVHKSRLNAPFVVKRGLVQIDENSNKTSNTIQQPLLFD